MQLYKMRVHGNPSGKRLTSGQISGFSIDFFLAGYETTTTTLGFTSYLLAMNTDVQEKLQAEIDKYFGRKSSECVCGHTNVLLY